MKHSRILLLVLAFILIAGNLWINRWPTNLYYGDSNGYYLHVVSFWVNQDVGDYDKTITTLREVNPASGDPREDEFGIRLTEKGRRYIKYTLGVPLMESPFFLLAHLYATISPKYEANGWTPPYLFVVGFAIIFYVLLGFYCLIDVLKNYFSDIVVTLVCLALVLATNLFYQTNYVTMSHGFLFAQHCLLIYLSHHFHRQPTWQKALGIGAAVGLIALTRVPEVISALVPLLWGVYNWKTFQERIQFFLKHFHYLLLAGLGFLVVFSLQFAYWYYVSGHLVFNPYKGEGFNFLKPRFYNAFFHFKNGWLLYTPIMALSLVGLLLLRKYQRGLLLPIFSFVLFHAWIHYSYYVFSYFPGLGQRPMVETYPLLSFGLAACFATLLNKKFWSWLPYGAIAIFGLLNLFQTWQMAKGVTWSERHNAAFYWATFGTMKSSLNSLRAYDTKELQPEEEEITFVKTLFSQNFEDTSLIHTTAANAFAGEKALLADQEFHTLLDKFALTDAQGGDWLKVSVQAYMPKEGLVGHRDYAQNLFIELYDKAGKRRKERNIKPSTHLGNTIFSIWTPGNKEQWGEASFYTKIPPSVLDQGTAKIYIFNPSRQKLYLDDLKLELYRR